MSAGAIKTDFNGVILHENDENKFSDAITQPLDQINCETASENTEQIDDETDVFIDDSLTDRLEIVGAGNLNLKLETICRCCLTERDDLMGIFDSDNCVYSMITLLTTVQVSPDDAFPKNICVHCVEQLTKFVSFKQQIEAAHVTLEQCINERYADEAVLQKIKVKPQSDKLELVLEEPEKENMVEVFDDSIEENYGTDYIIEYEDDTILYSDSEQFKLVPEGVVNSSSSSAENATLEDKGTESDQRKCKTAESSLPLENDVNPSRSRKKIYSCEICDEKFNSRQLFFKHIKTHQSQQTDYSCKICNRNFLREADFQCHMKTDHVGGTESENNSDAPFKCEECETFFTIEHDLYIHGSIHAEDGCLTCRACSKEFINLPKLKRHIKTHFQDKPIKCEECGRGFSEMASLTRHFRIHTNEQRDRKFICSCCDKAYYDSHSLAIHVRTHTGEKPWSCDMCDKRFTDSRLLNSHLRTHLNERNEICTICDRGFTHRSTLISHMRTHTGEKPFVCPVCNKSFIQSSNLILHQRVHSGEKPYQCTKCTRAFRSSSTLAMHVRTHTGEKPYCCKLCGKSFARHNLTIHMRTHTGEKPYECTICARKFTTSGQLLQHKRTHTGEKPFVCEICQKRWTTSSYLKKHLQTHCENLEKPTIDDNSVESIMEKNRHHSVRIEEIQSDAEFNENAMLVNDLLASVVDVNGDVLQAGSVDVPELATTDSNPGLDLSNAIDPNILRIQQCKS